jgi:DNA-binding LytR/AlgR family response regulator
MKCILIEDDPFQRNLISQYIDQLENVELVNQFDSAVDAIRFIQRNTVDLILLDIELPEMNGVEFLEQFKPESEIILISGKDKYAVDGFDLEVADYLMKPISFARFNRAISKIMLRKQQDQVDDLSQFLFIKDKGVYQKVLISDIQYIQSSKSKRTMLYSSMDGMLRRLPSNFMRVHRSFIVNLNAIDKVNGNMVEVNNQTISVSKTYQHELMGQLGLKVKHRQAASNAIAV